MAFWNTNDREESKPTWLNPAQKKECVRTNRGWEMPVANGISNLAGQFRGTGATGTTSTIPQFELLVATPLDPSVAGVAASNFAGRNTARPVGSTGTTAEDVPYSAPYFSCPFQGDGSTAGGPGPGPDAGGVSGVSHNDLTNFGLNRYGVSTLNWSRSTGLTAGLTGYIKVVANDANFTNTISITMTGSSGAGGGAGVGWNFFTGSNLLDNTKVPLNVYQSMFGPTASDNNNIGVIVLPSSLQPRGYSLTASVSDGTTAGGGTAGFYFTVVN